LRVLRDVTVQRGGDDEFVAISRERATPGELLTLERLVNGALVSARVRVIDSRPAIIGGTVRHRLRLERIENPDAESPVS